MSILPPKLLTGSITDLFDNDYWNEDTGDGDIFLGYPYKWEVTFSVVPQPHSSPSSQTPFEYNGLDVKVGNWVANAFTNGACFVITEILSQDSGSVTCIIEDFERYSLFIDPSLSGYPVSTGDIIIFELDDDGLPIISPIMNGLVGDNGVDNINSRFAYRNLYSSYISVIQNGHDFSVGDVISPDPTNAGKYVLADEDDSDNAIGIITSVKIPGTNYFNYRPIGRLINNVEPPLVGNHGDVFYLGKNGELTNVKPSLNARPIYMRLDLPTRAILMDKQSVVDKTIEMVKYDVEVVDDQTTFILPSWVEGVTYMTINGLENENFIFDDETKIVTFDPIQNGYGVEASDTVFFLVQTLKGL